jgi:hypothetical protein
MPKTLESAAPDVYVIAVPLFMSGPYDDVAKLRALTKPLVPHGAPIDQPD